MTLSINRLTLDLDIEPLANPAQIAQMQHLVDIFPELIKAELASMPTSISDVEPETELPDRISAPIEITLPPISSDKLLDNPLQFSHLVASRVHKALRQRLQPLANETSQPACVDGNENKRTGLIETYPQDVFDQGAESPDSWVSVENALQRYLLGGQAASSLSSLNKPAEIGRRLLEWLQVSVKASEQLEKWLLVPVARQRIARLISHCAAVDKGKLLTALFPALGRRLSPDLMWAICASPDTERAFLQSLLELKASQAIQAQPATLVADKAESLLLTFAIFSNSDNPAYRPNIRARLRDFIMASEDQSLLSRSLTWLKVAQIQPPDSKEYRALNRLIAASGRGKAIPFTGTKMTGNCGSIAPEALQSSVPSAGQNESLPMVAESHPLQLQTLDLLSGKVRQLLVFRGTADQLNVAIELFNEWLCSLPSLPINVLPVVKATFSDLAKKISLLQPGYSWQAQCQTASVLVNRLARLKGTVDITGEVAELVKLSEANVYISRQGTPDSLDAQIVSSDKTSDDRLSHWIDALAEHISRIQHQCEALAMESELKVLTEVTDRIKLWQVGMPPDPTSLRWLSVLLLQVLPGAFRPHLYSLLNGNRPMGSDNQHGIRAAIDRESAFTPAVLKDTLSRLSEALEARVKELSYADSPALEGFTRKDTTSPVVNINAENAFLDSVDNGISENSGAKDANSDALRLPKPESAWKWDETDDLDPTSSLFAGIEPEFKPGGVSKEAEQRQGSSLIRKETSNEIQLLAMLAQRHGLGGVVVRLVESIPFCFHRQVLYQLSCELLAIELSPPCKKQSDDEDTRSRERGSQLARLVKKLESPIMSDLGQSQSMSNHDAIHWENSAEKLGRPWWHPLLSEAIGAAEHDQKIPSPKTEPNHCADNRQYLFTDLIWQPDRERRKELLAAMPVSASTRRESLRRLEKEEQKTREVLNELSFESILYQIATVREKLSSIETPNRQFSPDGGLLLLWPFLPTLFSRLSLLDNTDKEAHNFVNEQARAKAYALLLFMLGDDGRDGFRAVANILVGYELDAVVPELATLSENEQLEAEALLHSAITRWTALKDMPVKSFRALFLHRDALCECTETGYMIKVQKQTIDILIRKMPWGLGTFTLPWLGDRLISVDWPY